MVAKKNSTNARLKPEELTSVRVMLKALRSCNDILNEAQTKLILEDPAI